MRTSIATLAVASLITILAVSAAQATPTQVNVRIEGRSETLFEGPIWTEGHDVQASSDTKQRSCDGINSLDPQNKTSGPTPTAASVDAMSLIGETFDGQWYPGYDDYFVTRFGPDREEEGMSWGILVNNVFTDVGGCQYELSTGDEVLWAYNAFGHKPFLAVFPVGDVSGSRPLTATAELNKPFQVEVLDYSDDTEDEPPAHPERTGASPYEGAEVTPVLTGTKGFEKLETENPVSVSTDAQGMASITFTAPGWHRIKATALGSGGKEDAIRSNRLDVCVPAQGKSGCGSPPTDDQVRTPPHTEEEVEREEAVGHEEEARLEEEEAERDEDAKRREEEAKATSEPGGKSEVPLPTSAPPVVTSFGTSVSPRPSVVHREKQVAKKRRSARCVHTRHGGASPNRRARPKCKTATVKRPKPKRNLRHGPRGR